MILYDIVGRKYIAKDARLADSNDEKAHYKKMFYNKINLYKEYYVEAIGDDWNSKCIYDVRSVENGVVKIKVRNPSGALYTVKCLCFEARDLDGSNEDFIQMLNSRAFAVLRKAKKRRNESIRLLKLGHERELARINKLIKRTGFIAYKK